MIVEQAMVDTVYHRIGSFKADDSRLNDYRGREAYHLSQDGNTVAVYEKRVNYKGYQEVLAIEVESEGNVLTFYEPTPLPASLFAQDEIYATVIGRWAWPGLLRTKKPLKWATPVEGQTGGLNLLTLVKGSKNAALVHEFINFWLSTEVQTGLARDLVDSPTNKEVRLAPEQAELMTFGQEQVNAIQFLPPDVLLRERAGWVEKWNSKITR